MHYYSTNDPSVKADFKEATIKGQAPGKGLYFPSDIAILPQQFINDLDKYSKEEIALALIKPYVDNSIPPVELKNIVTETVAFDFPLVPITGTISSLELFHGPTLAFKDVGARFMSRCLRYFVRNENKKITVLVATSGDTGGAVADGFYKVDGVDVVILYPSGKVSDIQELQLTTLGNNITALEVEGTFDDCQQLVKAVFDDGDLNQKFFLTSANSINIARWLPQQFYYFFAYQQWADKKLPPVISVPSGNFGNICAGMLANYSGLPVQHFIAACNANNAIPEYLKDGHYQPKPSVATISNAMDVGNPSNFIRMLQLVKSNLPALKNKLSSYSITDAETKEAIKDVYLDTNYLLDPHGAVGYCGLKKYLSNHPEQRGIFLETAHPIKFYDVVEPIINKKIELPQSIIQLSNREKKSIKIKKDFAALKVILNERS